MDLVNTSQVKRGHIFRLDSRMLRAS